GVLVCVWLFWWYLCCWCSCLTCSSSGLQLWGQNTLQAAVRLKEDARMPRLLRQTALLWHGCSAPGESTQYTHAHTYTHTHTQSHTHTHPHTHPLFCSLSHSHTHTHHAPYIFG